MSEDYIFSCPLEITECFGRIIQAAIAASVSKIELA
jgi:hypothetical protein